MRDLLRFLVLGAGLAAAGFGLAADLAQIRGSGVIKVAVYKDFAPFSDEGKGIDVEIAGKLAEKLGVRVSLLPFDADENMSDDLRNMVWKGHYLGYGPADLMMHVPVDKDFMESNKRVKIFAPYYREILQIVRNLDRIPKLENIAALDKEPIGTEAESIGSLVLVGAEGGRLREQVRHYKSIDQAVADMRAGKLSAVLATRSQIEAAMKGQWSGYAMSNPPLPGLPQAGWVLGLAVKTDNEELARALQQAMNELDAEGQLNRIFERFGVRRLAPL